MTQIPSKSQTRLEILLERLDTLKANHPELTSLCDEFRQVAIEFDGIVFGIESILTQTMAAEDLRLGDGLRWQGEVLEVIGLHAIHSRITVIASGLPGGPVDVTFGRRELVTISLYRPQWREKPVVAQ